MWKRACCDGRLTEAKVFLARALPALPSSDAARKYLSGDRTASGGTLSLEAQEYLRSLAGPAGRRTLLLKSPLMQGKDVLEAQRSLTRKGFPLVAIGVFWAGYGHGREGVSAAEWPWCPMVSFGPKTWDLLLDRLLFLSTPFLIGDDVRALQRALVRSGYPVAVDGIFWASYGAGCKAVSGPTRAGGRWGSWSSNAGSAGGLRERPELEMIATPLRFPGNHPPPGRGRGGFTMAIGRLAVVLRCFE